MDSSREREVEQAPVVTEPAPAAAPDTPSPAAGPLTAARIAALQRGAGNAAVSRLLNGRAPAPQPPRRPPRSHGRFSRTPSDALARLIDPSSDLATGTAGELLGGAAGGGAAAAERLAGAGGAAAAGAAETLAGGAGAGAAGAAAGGGAAAELLAGAGGAAGAAAGGGSEAISDVLGGSHGAAGAGAVAERDGAGAGAAGGGTAGEQAASGAGAAGEAKGAAGAAGSASASGGSAGATADLKGAAGAASGAGASGVAETQGLANAAAGGGAASEAKGAAGAGGGAGAGAAGAAAVGGGAGAGAAGAAAAGGGAGAGAVGEAKGAAGAGGGAGAALDGKGAAAAGGGAGAGAVGDAKGPAAAGGGAGAAAGAKGAAAGGGGSGAAGGGGPAAGAKGGAGAAQGASADAKGGESSAGGGKGGGAAHAGGGGAGPAINKDPHADPAFQAMKGRSAAVAGGSKAHTPAAAGAANAQSAAAPPANDISSQAQAAQVEEMATKEPGAFDRAAFIAAVKEAVDHSAPKNLEEADEFKDGGAAEVKGKVSGIVKGGKEESQKDIKDATVAAPDASKAKAKQVEPMQNDPVGQAAPTVGAASAMPAPVPQQATDLSSGPNEIDKQMADAEVTDEQIKKSNEPTFNDALTARDEAKEHSDKAPDDYRKTEQGVLGKAKGDAQGLEGKGLQEMHGARGQALQQALGHKQGAKTEDESKRAKVASDIQGIYERTKTDVTKTLGDLDGKVDQAFTAGEGAARKNFEDYVGKRMDAYKDDRYSGILGPAKWVKDKLAGMPEEVNAFYAEGKTRYLADMDTVIGKVADVVGAGLTAARARIAQGKAEIAKYVAQLPQDLQKVGKEAESKLEGQFEQLSADVDAKQSEMVDVLARKYVESRDALDARIDEMKAANRGLVDKAIDAVQGVIKTIIQLKNMLLGVLAKAADVIGDIIADPIGFLGKLVDGIKAGLSRFVGNIASHLQEGLMGWLFGAIGRAGIQLPKNFDIAGIFDLVMQVLGLTYRQIRNRVVKLVGEKVVTKLEQTVDVFKVLVTEGVPGLWKWIKDKVGDLEETVIGGIKTFIIEKVIKAGITWLIAFLNPAAAFIKACKMIYDVIMFIIERGSEIMDFVRSILDSIGAIAKGNIGIVAQKVEDSLARALPLAISFLASLLGLGGISEKIQSIIHKVQAPVGKAVDTVVMGAVKGAKKLFGGAAKWVKGKAKKVKDWAKDKYESGKQWAKDKYADVKDRVTGGSKDADSDGKDPAAATGDQQDPDAPQKPMEPVVVPFDMKGEGHRWIVRENEAGEVEVVMASEELPFTQKFRAYQTELDNWRHYLESVRPNLPPDIQRQIDAKLAHLKNIRVSQIGEYKAIHDRVWGSRRGGVGHEDPAREKQALAALRDKAEADAAAIRAWAAESEVQDISSAAVGTTLATLGRRIYDTLLNERRQKVDEILSRFRTPNGQPVRYRGSLAEGKKGEHKAGVRWDPGDFDLDLYVVDAAWHAQIVGAFPPARRLEYQNRPIPANQGGREASALQADVIAALEAPGAVPGLRQGENYILIRKQEA